MSPHIKCENDSEWEIGMDCPVIASTQEIREGRGRGVGAIAVIE